MSIYRLKNEPKLYAWGSLELIPGLMRTDSNGQPQAEVWFGSHKLDPSEIDDPVGGNLLERVGHLPYLVKLLAAAKPLSIQAHPTKERAIEQFGLGNPSYQDDNHKPELIVAVSDFSALCGFRPLKEIERDLGLLTGANPIFHDWLEAFRLGGLKAATGFALEASSALVSQLVEHAAVLDPERKQLIEQLNHEYPLDSGIAVSVLMNLITLEPGQALYLPAGNIHSYLAGLGVEVMAASDNVLRGGLTSKPLDKEELMQVLEFEPLEHPKVSAKNIAGGLVEYPVGVPDFKVYQVSPSSDRMLIDLKLVDSAILVCIAGEIVLSNSLGEMEKLGPGEAAFIRSANLFSITGSGTGYLAMG